MHKYLAIDDFVTTSIIASIIFNLVSHYKLTGKKLKHFEIIDFYADRKDKKLLLSNLEACTKLPLDEVPSLKQFHNRLKEQGFKSENVKYSLKAIISQYGLKSNLGLVAYRIKSLKE